MEAAALKAQYRPCVHPAIDSFLEAAQGLPEDLYRKHLRRLQEALKYARKDSRELKA